MNQKGISLITLIITVIVIFFIAAITLYSGQTTPELASRAVFMQELDDLRVELGILRANNYATFGNENEGFEEVTVIGAPQEFVSTSDDLNVIKGYLINFAHLNKEISFGKGTVRTAGKVQFLQDDVLVYDKDGTIFYALGFEDQETGAVYFNMISNTEEE